MTTNLSDLKKKTTKKRGGKRADHEGSIYYMKSRKLWVAAIRLGYDEKGKPIRKAKYAPTQQEAVEALAALKEKYTFPESIKADKMTTADWIEKWLSVYVTPRVKASTQNLYYSILRKYAIPAIGKIPLSSLTEMDIQSIIFGPLQKKYRAAAIFRLLMSAMMKKAVKCRLLKYSPAADLELPKRPEKRKFVKPSPQDWKKLIEYQSDIFYCWRWIILTEYVTGARLAEILALRWEDIKITSDKNKITGGTIHIRHALYTGMKKKGDSQTPLYLGSTKTAQGNRVLALPIYYCCEIQHYRNVQRLQQMLVPDWQESSFVFTKWNGAPIRPNNLSNYFLRIRRKLGIGSTFHMLRHDMASRMKNSSCFDLKDIQSQLGHSSINITMDIYTHIDEKVQQEKVGTWLEKGLTTLMTPQPKTETQL